MAGRELSDEQLRRGTEEVMRLQALIRGTMRHLKGGVVFDGKAEDSNGNGSTNGNGTRSPE